MEDTDEDFFDKLVDDVDDQFKITSSSLSSTTATESSVINRSDEAKANSGIGDGRNTVKELGKEEDDNNNNKVASTISTGVTDDRVDPGQSLVSSNSYVFDNVVQYHGTGDGSGVKEVQWSAFTSEPLDNTSNVFGSYSDFFTEFDSNLVDSTGKGDNFVNSEADSVGNSSHVESVVDYSHQFQESQSYTTSGRQSTDGQDLNSTQYWENLYPGWKYDANTGQWYQIDESYDATLNAQIVDNSSSASDWTVSNVKTEATNLQQTSQCFVGEKSPNENVTCWSPNSQTSHTNESLSNWSQTSQGNNNGYPPHMYFDPQYPGWYYDMNIQEWRGLDAYNSQLTDQNSFSASNSYYGNEQLVGKQQGWQPDTVNNVNQYQSYGANFREDNNVNQQQSYDYGGTGSSFNKSSQSQSFGSSANFSQPFGQSFMEQNEMMNATKAYGSQNQLSHSQQSVQQNGHKKRYGSTVERSSAGQPPHALATFGFGGKLIVMKNTTAVINASYGGQDSSARSISVLNLSEVVTGVGDVSSSGTGVHGYFHTLCRQSFPGPLAGGNVSSKDLNRWIDERITHPTETDYKKDQVLRLLLSLLKIASQHYGKLRSPFGTDTTTKENDAPDVAVARLFASAKKNSAEYGNFGSFVNCLQQLPSEGQTRATAAEVQTLLVSGRKMEALHRAQEGQLWGLALVLAAQLGDQFYMDTVRNMALHQLVAGSPLRTLCLLIAGQPADVFSTYITADDGTVNMFQQPTQAQLGANAMLDDWEENLAMITANRTKDDELVLIHLGDCLWKETSNIIAAHICYLVAEANFEPYSDSARLCLIGADHWKHPRTYACPEAIQRTEVYEYSKLLGNSQFTLLPFQPYKLIYANMLAEVGRVSDSLKYCQVISKSLKTGRAPEVETWRHLVISLEERIKAHQQGGFSTNLAPGKLVGKLLNLFDSTAHRVVGGLPPPVPSSTSGSSTQNDHYHQPTGPRVSSSQSTMAMSSLVPSASMEPITQKSAEGNNRRTMHNRSVSEPDFSRSPRQKQVDSSKENSGDSQSKTSTSRFGRLGFGSQLFQKTVGLVLKPRQDKQAKLGETNKFYFDEKLKRWVEEGVDPPAEEPALAPPPRTMTSFQTSSDYASKSASKSEGSLSNGSLEFSSGNTTVGHSSGIPPIPASSSQFSARGRMGVRARYVDTFNQGGGNTTKLFQSPSASSIKPVTKSNPKFFVPKAVPSVDQPTDTYQENTQQQQQTTTVYDETHSPTSKNYNPFQPPSYQSSMQRFASMDDISKGGIIPSFPSTSSSSPHSRRTVSWGGSTDERFTVSSSEMKPNGEVLGIMPQKSFMPSDPPVVNGDGFNDDLHEVEL